MPEYKVLKKQNFYRKNYSLVPIRYEDRYFIMQWRNEQMYHLRQNEPLTKEQQDLYFNNVVEPLFNVEKPIQILFSFLENKICIGYGGLVHINWADKNAEISFIMDTKFEKERFEEIWLIYLDLIEQVAFNDIKLIKIFTYAFDLRPRLYTCLEKAGYRLENTIEEANSRIIIHSKYKTCVK